MGAYCDSHVYTMKFYANQSKVPTIAHPKVKFRFKFDVKYENAPSIYRDTTYVQEYSNAGYGTSMPLFSYNSYLARTVTHPIGRDDTDTNIVWEIYTDVKLLDSPDYKLLNIISLRK